MPSKTAPALLLLTVVTVLAVFVIQAQWAPGAHSEEPGADAVATLPNEPLSAKSNLEVKEAVPNAASQYAANLPESARLDVPSLSQLPELFNGCEVTSLTMILRFAGIDTDKQTLSSLLAKDPAELVLNADGSIASWGNPHKGFVGDVTGELKGYGVYHEPIANLINTIAPDQALDLTGKPFEAVLSQIAAGKPVLVWNNSTFGPLRASNWVSWKTKDGPVRATWKEHAVVLTGYDADTLYINDPLDGSKDKKVNRQLFVQAWEQMGEQAVTYK